MLIAITGTPGTGKTRIARLLAKKLDANLISIRKVIRNLSCKMDKKRKTKIVDMKELQRIVNRNIKREKINIIEGHMSHLLKSDLIIILRTNPILLKKRLSKRHWPKLKIHENVQAEILDEITIEAMQRHKHKNIYELDTSNVRLETAVNIAMKIIKNFRMGKTKILNNYLIGKIYWTRKYMKELIDNQKNF